MSNTARTARLLSTSTLAAVLGVVASAIVASPASAVVTTFDSGTDGWGVFFANDGVLGDFEQPAGGNPGAHLQWIMVDTFGLTLKNDTNAAVIGNYGTKFPAASRSA